MLCSWCSPLHQGVLFTLRAPLLLAKSPDTGGFYSSFNQDGSMGSLPTFRGSAVYFLAMILNYDDLFLCL